jgi:hypothetical protein
MSVAENFSLFPLSKWFPRKPGPGFPTAESTHEALATGNVTGTNITSGTYEIYRLHHFDKSPNFKWHIILIKNFPQVVII